MKAKKLLSFVFIVTFLTTSFFVLTSCGDSGSSNQPASNENTPANQGESQDSAPSGAASGGRKVMLYSSLKINQLDALKAGFNAKYPDITFDYYAAGTGKVLTKLATEEQSGKISADMIWVGDSSNYLNFKEKGLLQEYSSPEASSIDPKFEDPDHFYIGARLIVVGFSYNTMNTPAEKAPKNWNDLLNSEYKDQLVMSDPGEAGTTMYAVSALIENKEYGWEFFDRLFQNGMILESGTNATINKIAAGAFKAGIGVDYVTRTAAKSGSKIDFSYPERDLVVISSPIALMKNSPNPEEAKLLYDFIISQEGQQILAENQATPVRRGIKLEGLPVEEIAARAMEVDPKVLAEKKKEYLEEFDKRYKSN